MSAKKPFSVSSKELGRGRAKTERFGSLAEAQAYVKARWQGPEYIDGAGEFHTDYCTYECGGFELANVGSRGSGEEGFWDWSWKELDPAKLAKAAQDKLDAEEYDPY